MKFTDMTTYNQATVEVTPSMVRRVKSKFGVDLSDKFNFEKAHQIVGDKITINDSVLPDLTDEERSMLFLDRKPIGRPLVGDKPKNKRSEIRMDEDEKERLVELVNLINIERKKVNEKKLSISEYINSLVKREWESKIEN